MYGKIPNIAISSDGCGVIIYQKNAHHLAVEECARSHGIFLKSRWFSWLCPWMRLQKGFREGGYIPTVKFPYIESTENRSDDTNSSVLLSH
jgi:hypothetical protein